MTFIAKYRGVCAECDEAVRPGDEVKYRGEGEERELVHERCPVVEIEQAPVCGGCWLIHPVGACDL